MGVSTIQSNSSLLSTYYIFGKLARGESGGERYAGTYAMKQSS